MYATLNGHPDVENFLLEHGAEVSAQDQSF